MQDFLMGMGVAFAVAAFSAQMLRGRGHATRKSDTFKYADSETEYLSFVAMHLEGMIEHARWQINLIDRRLGSQEPHDGTNNQQQAPTDGVRSVQRARQEEAPRQEGAGGNPGV